MCQWITWFFWGGGLGGGSEDDSRMVGEKIDIQKQIIIFPFCLGQTLICNDLIRLIKINSNICSQFPRQELSVVVLDYRRFSSTYIYNKFSQQMDLIYAVHVVVNVSFLKVVDLNNFTIVIFNHFVEFCFH